MDPSPSKNHHHIVFLQGDFIQTPDFELPDPHSYTSTIYPQTSLAEVHERIHDASIIVLSALRVDATALSPEVSPNLKLIVAVATGYDCIDLDACRARGIVVCNTPNCNVEAVSEHAIGLYFTTRRKMLDLHTLTRAGEWPRKRTLMFQMLDRNKAPPLSCQDEVAGIIGNGGVGKKIAGIARNLGMKVLISGRKSTNGSDVPSQTHNGQPERLPFDTVIKQSTVLFLAVPLMDSTRNLLSTAEFEAMSPRTIIVNVSRGGIVDEEALVQALHEGQIAGAATDVFGQEPAGPENSPLLAEDTKDLNLVVTPHLAWLAQKTLDNYSATLKRAIEGWCAGQPINVVV